MSSGMGFLFLFLDDDRVAVELDFDCRFDSGARREVLPLWLLPLLLLEGREMLEGLLRDEDIG